ncbi:TPA: hypothetical protein QCX47_003057 [Bacillus mycoides]|nr:hypothetical protein [Bacillus mycoides]
MNLGMCCYKGCTRDATTTGYIYGHFKESEDKTDKFIDLVVCDKHEKEKDFYPENKQDGNKKHRQNPDKKGE